MIRKKNKKRFTREEAEMIKKEYESAPKCRNQFDKKSEVVSMRDLTQKYNCSIFVIESIIHGTYYPEENLK